MSRRKSLVQRRVEWIVAGWIAKILLSPILVPLWIVRRLL